MNYPNKFFFCLILRSKNKYFVDLVFIILNIISKCWPISSYYYYIFRYPFSVSLDFLSFFWAMDTTNYHPPPPTTSFNIAHKW